MPTDAELLVRAARVVDDVQLGLLTTCDADGAPHSRWMAAVAEHGLRVLLALTAARTRKLAHLAANPRVCWVFSTRDMGDVVTLEGEARVDHDLVRVQGAWDRLAEAVRTYQVGPLTDDEHLEMVVIETTVRRAEILSPALRIMTPRGVPLAG